MEWRDELCGWVAEEGFEGSDGGEEDEGEGEG